MSTGDAPEQATETVYASVDWTVHATGNEVKAGDPVTDVPVEVADWLVRAGIVSRERAKTGAQHEDEMQAEQGEPPPPSKETGHRRTRKD